MQGTGCGNKTNRLLREKNQGGTIAAEDSPCQEKGSHGLNEGTRQEYGKKKTKNHKRLLSDLFKTKEKVNRGLRRKGRGETAGRKPTHGRDRRKKEGVKGARLSEPQ